MSDKIIDISDIHKNHVSKLEKAAEKLINLCNNGSFDRDIRNDISYVCDVIFAMLLDKRNKDAVKDAEKWSKKMISKHGDDIKAVLGELGLNPTEIK